MLKPPPPELLPLSQCDISLKFKTHAHWPEPLPGVAVHGVVVAGFEQELVLNHRLDPQDRAAVFTLISSLHPQLSFVEAVLFRRQAQGRDWIPTTDLLQNWGFHWSEQTAAVAERLLTLPENFQDWLSEKRVGPQELLVLLSARELGLNSLLQCLLSAMPSRQQGVQILEMAIELMLLGKAPENLLREATESPEDWMGRLKSWRFPETTRKDLESRQKMRTLAWPGQSQVRWVRQGDRAGLELKLFVTSPSDLRKSVHSLQKIQDLLDENPKALWPEQ